MKKVIILHNPKAGNRSFDKLALISEFKVNSFKPKYYKVKKCKKWKQKWDQAAFVVSAGGDGTIRSIVKMLMKRALINKQPTLAIFPIGTANNISKALGVNKVLNPNFYSKNQRTKIFQFLDVGIVNLKKDTNFFLESAGFGLFALLIKQTDTSHLIDNHSKLNFALRILQELIFTVPSYDYKIKTESGVYTGKSILIEVTNCSYIGPNVQISPTAKLNDGLLDIVIIEENQREEFANHIRKLINNEHSNFDAMVLQTENVEIETLDTNFHIDDEYTAATQQKIKFEMRKSILKFLSKF